MQAARIHQPAPAAERPLRFDEIPEPSPGPGQILVRVEACAVCRTDLQLAEGDIAARHAPFTPGHQLVGTVEAVGDRADGWRTGDRASAGWLAWACGECRFCASSRENLCEQARFTGWDTDGGFADYALVEAAFAFRVPEGLSALEAAPLLCGGVIGYRSLRVSGIQPGGRLGLFGFGASASLAIQVAVHWGCEVFVCTRSAAEQQRARDLGAAWAGGYDDPVPAPLDAAITFAPAGSVVVDALRAVDRGGTVAINAIHLDRVPEFDYDLLWLERSIRSVANYTRQDAREFLDLAAAIPVRTASEVYPLSAANEALLALAEGRVSGSAVLATG